MQANRPLLSKTKKLGTEFVSPLVSIINREALIMLRLATEMGFTPSSRCRIECPTGPSDDAGAKYLI